MSDVRIRDCVQAAGVELDLRRMPLPKNLQARYQGLPQGAVAELARIEAGEMVTVDEGRPVGH